MNRKSKILIALLVLFVGLPGILLLTGSFYSVEDGHHAILLRFGNVISPDEGIPPGLHLKMPISDHVKHIKTDPQMYQFSHEVSDSQTWDVSVKWQVSVPNRFYMATAGQIDTLRMRLRARILASLRDSGQIDTDGLNSIMETEFGTTIVELEAKLRDSM